MTHTAWWPEASLPTNARRSSVGAHCGPDESIAGSPISVVVPRLVSATAMRLTPSTFFTYAKRSPPGAHEIVRSGRSTRSRSIVATDDPSTFITRTLNGPTHDGTCVVRDVVQRPAADQ